jgi:hypothetical protein
MFRPNLSFFASRVLSILQNCYWYNGRISEDAIVGGKFLARNVYIGQAYVKNEKLTMVMKKSNISLLGVQECRDLTKF